MQNITSIGKDVDLKKVSILLVEIQLSTAPNGNSTEVPEKNNKKELAHNPAIPLLGPIQRKCSYAYHNSVHNSEERESRLISE